MSPQYKYPTVCTHDIGMVIVQKLVSSIILKRFRELSLLWILIILIYGLLDYT